MSDTQHSTTTVEHPNADVIAGLRQAAAWLAQHPELPPAAWSNLCFGYDITDDARGRLAQLAAALGEDAIEDRSYGRIEIQARFGAVRVFAGAAKQALVSPPVALPEPEPIVIKRTEPPVTPEEDEAFGAAV